MRVEFGFIADSLHSLGYVMNPPLFFSSQLWVEYQVRMDLMTFVSNRSTVGKDGTSCTVGKSMPSQP